jgi:hypothetical protein
LYDLAGLLVNELNVPALGDDMAYGRVGDFVGPLALPTPLQPNIQSDGVCFRVGVFGFLLFPVRAL